ncbi:hypothetical protein SELMODRAFT_412607 [Selaginella moellendorffii]|uniref:RING-type E3 ubiquitin transferase n=1 Tax=Selaginella moellendorffii TaxID=88036 RepID=D8RM16_SELML|nr:hypothetical protein SELMODRAFT_412607 [Selaginella moellendorffii]
MESTQSAQDPANGHHHRSQHSTRAALNQIGAKGGIAIVVGSLFAAVVSMCVVAFCVWMWGNRGGSGSIDQEQQQLGDHHQPRAIASQGLSSKAIDRIPKVSLATLFQIRGSSDVCCPVCLTEFQASDHSDTIWLIPGCNHSFHSECIQKWLAAHTSCPERMFCMVDLVAMFLLESQSPGALPSVASHRNFRVAVIGVLLIAILVVCIALVWALVLLSCKKIETHAKNLLFRHKACVLIRNLGAGLSHEKRDRRNKEAPAIPQCLELQPPLLFASAESLPLEESTDRSGHWIRASRPEIWKSVGSFEATRGCWPPLDSVQSSRTPHSLVELETRTHTTRPPPLLGLSFVAQIGASTHELGGDSRRERFYMELGFRSHSTLEKNTFLSTTGIVF